MARRVLDTSVLIRHWHDCRSDADKDLSDLRESETEGWGKDLIRLRRADLILTPVYLEFVAGAQSARELLLQRSYLSPFTIHDQGNMLKDDWIEARRLAERVPKNGKPRQLGDCLIKAIARRLHLDVDSFDAGFPI